jgi:hypothetical protein
VPLNAGFPAVPVVSELSGAFQPPNAARGNL